jgi:hypothetical protein
MKIKTLSAGLQSSFVAAALMFGVGSEATAGGVLHSVHAGGPDSCVEAGCDANWSLNAVMYANGSVSGQLVDRFSQASGYKGIHAQIDCLAVEPGPNGWTLAWASGVITGGDAQFIGEPVLVFVIDSNETGNAADGISYSLIGVDQPCTDEVSFVWDYVNPVWKGQVKVQ